MHIDNIEFIQTTIQVVIRQFVVFGNYFIMFELLQFMFTYSDQFIQFCQINVVDQHFSNQCICMEIYVVFEH